jgi:myo-inositol 2-dehydrogenase / D-chiro-inositol 1-dehydrogenase
LQDSVFQDIPPLFPPTQGSFSMSQKQKQSLMSPPSRRDFIKTSVVAAGAAIGGLSLARSAHAAGSDVIRIGLVGAGNRGPGAVVNALTVDPGVRLVAMGDVFMDHIKSRLDMIKKEKPDQVQVDDAHCFAGLDSYRHVIESSDVVLIACAAKYHSYYLKAAIEAGKHVFVEKPHAIDPVGIREITAASEMAKQKNLSIMSGLHSRYVLGYQEGVKRVHDGAIGEVVAIEEHFERGPYNIVPRDPKLNEVEFQFSDQMHFTWLSGDDVLQSLSHNLDRSAWIMKEQMPVKCHGMGGRSASFGEVYGNVFDHHSVVYEYANGVRIYAFCRTQNGCYGNCDSIILGSKGRCNLTRCFIEGENKWRYEGPGCNPYDLEHKTFFEAIRSGKPINCGSYMANSATMGVMGQLSCYSGWELSAEQIGKSNFIFTPKIEDVRLDMEPPVKPDEKGNYPVPMPGITEFKI